LHRADLGLSVPLTTLNVLYCPFSEGTPMKAFVANLQSENLRRYFSKNTRPEPFLGLVPTDTESEDTFIRYVQQEFNKWASSA
jgi:hypothetical protein